MVSEYPTGLAGAWQVARICLCLWKVMGLDRHRAP